MRLMAIMKEMYYVIQSIDNWTVTGNPKESNIVHLSTMCHFSWNWPGQLSLFSNPPKNRNLEEDIEYCLPVKFRKIPLSGSWGIIQNASANQMPGWLSFFLISPKNTNFVEDVKFLHPVKIRKIPSSGFREVFEKCLSKSEAGRSSCFSNLPKNTILVLDVKFMLPVKFRHIPFSGFRKKTKMSQPIRDRAAILFFQFSWKKPTKLVEDVEFFLPVKFRQILFSGVRQVETVIS